MKLTKRLLSMLLVVCMVFTLLPTVALTASAATGDYELVTDASTLKVGDSIVIVASASNYALGTKQNSNNRDAVSVTKGDGTVTIGDTVQVLTLEEGTVSGTFGLYTGSGYLYAASSSKNYLKTQDTNNANGSWTITITSTGVATIKANGTNTRNIIKKNTSSALFSCYGSGQADVSIYKLNVGGSTTTATLTGITLDTTSVQTTFTVGDTFNSTGLVVTAAYDDNSTKQVTPTSVSAPDMTTAGTKTITVSYTENGVTVTADYTITVNEPTTYTVTYYSAGSVYGTATVVEGNAIGADNLPTPKVDGWTFIGWSTTEILTAQDNEPALYAGTETVTSNLNLYAVYAKASEGGAGSSITSLASGTYYMVDTYNGSYYAMSGTGTTSVTSVDISAAVTKNADGTISIDGTNSVI
ncbi:MAG: bacterial Ig-like domain-containing protein, partial [Candidatus Faecousia sp.]|nr:bacterial Ig-like domain-containing protein [Candidatus Faecousia sp.]